MGFSTVIRNDCKLIELESLTKFTIFLPIFRKVRRCTSFRASIRTGYKGVTNVVKKVNSPPALYNLKENPVRPPWKSVVLMATTRYTIAHTATYVPRWGSFWFLLNLLSNYLFYREKVNPVNVKTLFCLSAVNTCKGRWRLRMLIWFRGSTGWRSNHSFRWQDSGRRFKCLMDY